MTEFVEVSTPLGGFLILLGVVLLLLQGWQPVFANWLWAIVVSGAWMAFGSLFLYPDVRLYQYDESPLEELLAGQQSAAD